MPGPIYVIGHKNSDLDSVASAYAYARLLRLQGEEQAIAARHGELKPEVRFVLERYQVEPPEALEDVYLQVRDVMRRGVISARVDQPLLEAGQLLQEHNRRSMPVVDSENKVQGIIAVEDFAKLFFNDLDPQSVNRVPLQRDNLVRVLRGRVLVEGRRKLGNRVLVGAMQAETMADYIEPGCLVVLGDREDAQLTAIERGAAALVITGDLLVSERTIAAARMRGADNHYAVLCSGCYCALGDEQVAGNYQRSRATFYGCKLGVLTVPEHHQAAWFDIVGHRFGLHCSHQYAVSQLAPAFDQYAPSEDAHQVIPL